MKNITVEDLQQRISSGENLNIIDVREPAEYAEYNIGGKLVPLGRIAAMQLDELNELKGEELIIHCKAGSRSMQACAILENAGYKNVVNVTGGIMAWQKMLSK